MELAWNSCNIEPFASWHGEHEIADTACFGQFCSCFLFFAFYCSFSKFSIVFVVLELFMMAGTSELSSLKMLAIQGGLL